MLGDGQGVGGASGGERIDAILVTSAGCSAALRELEHWIGSEGRALAARHTWQAAAERHLAFYRSLR